MIKKAKSESITFHPIIIYALHSNTRAYPEYLCMNLRRLGNLGFPLVLFCTNLVTMPPINCTNIQLRINIPITK